MRSASNPGNARTIPCAVKLAKLTEEVQKLLAKCKELRSRLEASERDKVALQSESKATPLLLAAAESLVTVSAERDRLKEKLEKSEKAGEKFRQELEEYRWKTQAQFQSFVEQIRCSMRKTLMQVLERLKATPAELKRQCDEAIATGSHLALAVVKSLNPHIDLKAVKEALADRHQITIKPFAADKQQSSAHAPIGDDDETDPRQPRRKRTKTLYAFSDQPVVESFLGAHSKVMENQRLHAELIKVREEKTALWMKADAKEAIDEEREIQARLTEDEKSNDKVSEPVAVVVESSLTAQQETTIIPPNPEEIALPTVISDTLDPERRRVLCQEIIYKWQLWLSQIEKRRDEIAVRHEKLMDEIAELSKLEEWQAFSKVESAALCSLVSVGTTRRSTSTNPLSKTFRRPTGRINE
uniref:Uncharacterized protein n=1 Tax=Leersia perrieri TaxID=77586 RepID=A0A0D9XTI0_9ORYZ